MSPKVVWLFVFVILYWAYSIFWGIKCAWMAKMAGDYFIAGRQLSMWVFVLAATAHHRQWLESGVPREVEGPAPLQDWPYESICVKQAKSNRSVSEISPDARLKRGDVRSPESNRRWLRTTFVTSNT